MRLLWTTLASTILVGLLAFRPAFANQTPTHIRIVTEHLPPFQIEMPNGVEGFATEIVSTAISNTPYSFDIKLYPWTRSYNMALKKPNTCIYSIAKTTEREQLFTWVNTIAERNASFIGLAENNYQINSIEDAKKYNVAVIRDDVTHQYLIEQGFVEGINLYVVNNTHSLLKLIAQRKGVDLILIDAFTVKYRARFNQLDPAMFKNFYQINKQPLDYYLACNKATSPTIINDLRRAIDEMKANGQLSKIIDEWQYPKIKVNHYN
ncbi:substrate-binding periplasmic protein [Colwellia sp. MEBiC06753]